MRIAYLDCPSGISGDMTLGALVDAGVPLDQLNEAIGSLGLPGVKLVAQEVKKHGFRATQVTVEHEPEHKHRHLHQIEAMIDGSRLTPRQKDTARRIFQRLAEVEAKVHGTTVEKVHFHEVGRGRLDRRHRRRGRRLGPVGRGAFGRIAHSHRQRPNHHRPRRVQHSRARHGGTAPRHSAGRLRRSGRTDHAHRRGDRGHAGPKVLGPCRR